MASLARARCPTPRVAHSYLLTRSSLSAPLVDCYGVAYQIQEHAVQCMVSSDGRCATRDATRFGAVVLGALADVFALIESGALNGYAAQVYAAMIWMEAPELLR